MQNIYRPERAERLIEAEISGKWLRKFRKEAGFSQASLAGALKISNTARISDYENGITLPKLPTRRRIAAVLGCEVEDIWA